MSFNKNLDAVLERFKHLGEQLSQGVSDSKDFVKLSKEYSDLKEVAEAIETLRSAQNELKETQTMLKDPDLDKELKEMAAGEVDNLNTLIPRLEDQVKILLLPKDKDAERNVILEVRAGTGGEEAALFGAVLFRMYQRYAERHNLKFEIMEVSDTGIGGIKEATATISGKGAYARLKFESGVHRVQRVPQTESSGRIHTSAATVAVLPEVEEIDIVIEDKDIRVDVFRASGAGGQHVNTTDSAVRITHIPSGIVVSQQDEKSQHKNKAKAMKILRARLYDFQKQQADAERAQARKGMVGSGDRSERIRTYNYPQGRVTDHRINITLYKLEHFVDGDLDEMIDALVAEEQAQLLTEVM